MLKPKKQLWTLFELVQTRPLSSTGCRFPIHDCQRHHSSSQIHSSSPLSSSNNKIGTSTFPSQFSRNPRQFSGKNFCSSQTSNRSCWNCNAEPQNALFLVCESCRAIQPIDHSVDYFQIFGVEKKYEIEEHNLERKYKDWQKKLHPDLVHSKSEKEKEFAAEQSARVIDAYRTLNSPLSRAIYILKLEGVDVNEEETLSEPELLAVFPILLSVLGYIIMEIREAVEEAPDSEALNEIQSSMQEKLQHWSNSFANAFQSRKFEEAINCIHRMTYYDRVIEEIVKSL